MNIYQKIQAIRVKLAKDDIKKSGKNTYSNFDYYELSDFLPKINEYLEKDGLFTKFSILSKRVTKDEMAELKIINSEKPEEVVTFTAPTAEAKVGVRKDGTGGADPIQNQGAKITYMRRYLLMIAFEIVEQDAVDNQAPKKNGAKTVSKPKNQIACPHENQAVYRTNKEGPNKGKEFYKCEDCGLFLKWKK